MGKQSGKIQGTEKEFMDVFNSLCYSRSAWQVWADLISAIACTLSNVTDRTQKHFEAREKEYAQCIKRLGSVEIPAEILNIIVMALENKPEQDFLGKMYMNLNLGNHWKGQFFTPYDVCKMMSQMTVGTVDRQIEEQGYISICDPACGAGATLIAAANTLKESKYNFQNHVLFVGQDVDRVVAQMCYIQLSLLGCSGYIVVGDSLLYPMTGHALFPQESEYQEIWYMPMFYSEVWTMRRMIQTFSIISGTETTQKTVGKEQLTYFFNFEQEGNVMTEESKKALQSDEWQAVRNIIKSEVVKEYLATSYADDEKQCEITANSVKYKVLRRDKKTTFYDENGNTLFDVDNGVLAAEYEKISENQAEPETLMGKTIASIEKQAFDYAVQAEVKKENDDVAEKTSEDEAEKENDSTEKAVDTTERGKLEEDKGKTEKSTLVYSGVDGAVAKLQAELEKAKEKEFAKPVIEYLSERCRQSESLAADICQSHKTWEKCYRYIYEEARKKLNSKSGPVRDGVVFEWAEDYFHLDDKALEEKKAKEEAERKKKSAEKKKQDTEKKGKIASAKSHESGKEEEKKPAVSKPQREVQKQKPKKNELDGQMDMFSLMGM